MELDFTKFNKLFGRKPTEPTKLAAESSSTERKNVELDFSKLNELYEDLNYKPSEEEQKLLNEDLPF